MFDWLQLLPSLAIAGGAFYFAGELRANLTALREITSDHEDRLRELERPMAPEHLRLLEH